MSNLFKNLLIVLILVLILFVGYLVFFKDADIDEALRTAESEVVELESQKLLSTLSELESLDVSGDLFMDPLFLSLRDFRTPLTDEPSGRSNPFEPVVR